MFSTTCVSAGEAEFALLHPKAAFQRQKGAKV